MPMIFREKKSIKFTDKIGRLGWSPPRRFCDGTALIKVGTRRNSPGIPAISDRHVFFLLRGMGRSNTRNEQTTTEYPIAGMRCRPGSREDACGEGMTGESKNNTLTLENMFGRILTPFQEFLRRTTAGGIILMGTTVLSLILANSGWGDLLHTIWEQPLRMSAGSRLLEMSLHQFVNDGLMSLFFLLVGLELKREIIVGELSSWADAALPVIAAAGGMIVPGLFYHLVNPQGAAASGWGIPMATDIAFSVGILVMLARRIPPNLIIFLTALAIADDLGAVLVIALFYTSEISLTALGGAAGVLAVLFVLNRGGIRHPLPYVILGIALWFAFLQSGIHSTIAGVLLAIAIPARPAFAPHEFEERLVQLHEAFRAETSDQNHGDEPLSNPRMATIAQSLEKASIAVQSPLQHLEHGLSPWVTFVIIPIFALSNVGIDFSEIEFTRGLTQPVTLGVILGLVFGKFVGIAGAGWIAVKTGIGRLPRDVGLRHLLGVAWLGGIGFTMSLFISQLAFTNRHLVEQAKLGILVASTVSGCIGLAWLYFSQSAEEAPPSQTS